MTAVLVVEINVNEVALLSDRVRNDDRGTDDMSVCVYPLLLKLGSAFVELAGDGNQKSGTVPVALTEPEAWLLRGKVNTGDKSASDALLGVKLLSKLYRVLLQYNQDVELPTADSEGETMTDERKRALRRWVG